MKRIIGIAIILVAALSVYYAFLGKENNDAYIARITKLRKEKNNLILTGADSPFVDDTIKFAGLSYFDVDPKFKVQARLLPIENKEIVVLPTSDGAERSYQEYAYAEFELEEGKHRLLILELVDMGPYRGTLFLAFSDETSARETYGAGRYLDLKKIPEATSITLDFNEAYNPYCAYNDSYSCPLPPKENLLSIAILAGEKNYPK